MPLKNRSDCPISNTLELLGDRWSLLVVRDLLLHDQLEYGELREMEAGEVISTNILADRLSRLTEAGVLRKAPHPTDKKKYLYSLSKKGMALKPLLVEMAEWGLTYLDGTRPHATKGHFLKRH